MTKRCAGCSETKDLTEFHRYATSKDGHQGYCKECKAAYQGVNSHLSRQSTRKWRQVNPEKHRAKNKRFTTNLRSIAIIRYGGRCMDCGIEDVDMLTLDHINNDGAWYRKHQGAENIGAWAKKYNYPTGVLQVLCHNHNMKKEAERRRNETTK